MRQPYRCLVSKLPLGTKLACPLILVQENNERLYRLVGPFDMHPPSVSSLWLFEPPQCKKPSSHPCLRDPICRSSVPFQLGRQLYPTRSWSGNVIRGASLDTYSGTVSLACVRNGAPHDLVTILRYLFKSFTKFPRPVGGKPSPSNR